MMEKLRAAGLTITCDWTQAEGDVCACGHHRQEHLPFVAKAVMAASTQCAATAPRNCPCAAFNGIGVGGDSQLTSEARGRYALADMRGVLDADVVWLLAADDRGACGSWVELGMALARRETHPPGLPYVVVSGPRWQRTIFTELADKTFESDEEAFEHVVALHRTR